MSAVSGYRCIRCSARYGCDLNIDSRGCPACYGEAPSNLRVVYKQRGSSAIDSFSAATPLPSMWRYADHLPCPAAIAVSLGEGLTPLVSAPAIGGLLGVPDLHIKDESRNPTWSHKDRFSSVAVSAALQSGARVVATASSGNAGASLSAYAARAQLQCVVATFPGAARPMLAQIRKTGATIVPFLAKAHRWDFIAEGVERYGWFPTSPFRDPVVGSHPVGIEGYKTLAFEIVEQMEGTVPDWCVIPACYGDALAGLWYGFQELSHRHIIARMPRLVAAEVHGSLASALAGEDDRVRSVAPKFEPLAVSIGATRSTFQALHALRQSNGLAVPVSNKNLVSLQERLARTEGLLVELASVTPFAAIETLRKRDVIAPSHRVVAVVTACGLKDIDLSNRHQNEEPVYGSTAQAWAELPLRERSTPRAAPIAAEATSD